MKCLEGYTVGQVKELSREELKVLWNEMQEEAVETEIRKRIIDTLDVAEARAMIT